MQAKKLHEGEVLQKYIIWDNYFYKYDQYLPGWHHGWAGPKLHHARERGEEASSEYIGLEFING